MFVVQSEIFAIKCSVIKFVKQFPNRGHFTQLMPEGYFEDGRRSEVAVLFMLKLHGVGQPHQCPFLLVSCMTLSISESISLKSRITSDKLEEVGDCSG